MAILSLPKSWQAHHIKGLRPVLQVMSDLGFAAEACLEGTALKAEELELESATISFAQECQIYRNCLNLTQDPMLGLRFGQAFRPESYGLLGYAILSSATVEQALDCVVEFGILTFSHFRLQRLQRGSQVGLGFDRQYLVPEDLLALFCDRDLSAVLMAYRASNFARQTEQALALSFPHDGQGHCEAYRQTLGVSVRFNQANAAFWFPEDLLAEPMPQRDAEASAFCRQRCQSFLDSATAARAFQQQVWDCLERFETGVPSADQVAERMGCSTRTLRRRLSQEGQSFQSLVQRWQHQLACDWLQAGYSIQAVADRLGYSEAANFSHAFKRWEGSSPRCYLKNRLRAT